MEQIYSKASELINLNSTTEFKKLIKRQPKIINYIGRTGTPLLMHALLMNNKDCFRILLEEGANPNLMQIQTPPIHDMYMDTSMNMTPLFYASAMGYTEEVRLLLQYGANPLIESYMGQTAYDGAQNETIKNLLKNAIKLRSLMPLYVQSYKKNKKLPADLVRKVFETMI